MSDSTVLGLCTDHQTAGSITHSTIASVTGCELCCGCGCGSGCGNPSIGGPLGPIDVSSNTLLLTVTPPSGLSTISASILDLSAGTYGAWTILAGGQAAATGLFAAGSVTTTPFVHVTPGAAVNIVATTLGPSSTSTSSVLVTWTFSC